MEAFLALVCAASGYAACWFTKDEVSKAVLGTEAFVTNLEARAAAVKSAAETIKSAL
jgi:hypothetical protein